MKLNCEYCGTLIDSFATICPVCGGVNSNVHETSTPDTIEELKAWYKDNNLPDESITHFFIGRNYTGPRAYGVYKDGAGRFIVYQNKTDGTRVVHYDGGDEAYAVNELYRKLCDIMEARKNR